MREVPDWLVIILTGTLIGALLGCSTASEKVSDVRLDTLRHEEWLEEGEGWLVREVTENRTEGPSAFVLEEFGHGPDASGAVPASNALTHPATPSHRPRRLPLTRRVTMTTGAVVSGRVEKETAAAKTDVRSAVDEKKEGTVATEQKSTRTTGAPPWMVGLGILALFVVVAVALYSWTRRKV